MLTPNKKPENFVVKDGVYQIDGDFLFSDTPIEELEKALLEERRNPPPYMRSALTYQGGKFRLIQYLDSVLSRDKRVLIDVFTGSMTVVANLMSASSQRHFELAVCNDLNSHLILFYTCLLTPAGCNFSVDVAIAINRLCDSLINTLQRRAGVIISRSGNNVEIFKDNPDAHTKFKSLYQESILRRIDSLLIRFTRRGLNYSEQVDYAALFIMMTKMTRNGGFSVSNGRIGSEPSGSLPSGAVVAGARLFLEWLHPLIVGGNLQLRNEDYSILVDSVLVDLGNDAKEAFFYFDPPYYNTKVAYTANWNSTVETNFCLTLERLLRDEIHFALSNTIVHKGKLNDILLEFILRNTNLRVLELSINYSLSSNTGKTIEVLVFPKYVNSENLSQLNSRARAYAGRLKFEAMREISLKELKGLCSYPVFTR